VHHAFAFFAGPARSGASIGTRQGCDCVVSSGTRAMGIASSTGSEDGLTGEPWPAWGFRVISVEAGSPAARALVFPDRRSAAQGVRTPVEAPLVPYLDVVTSVNGIALGEESSRTGVFEREVAGSVDKPMLLEVYNVKTRRQRLVQLTPSRSWGGDGLLGLQVHHDAISDDADAVLHVMEVESGSPAAQYGFVAGDDYLLGTMDGPFRTVDEFIDFCTNAAVGETVLLFLLSAAADAVRAVVIVWDDTIAAHGLGVTLASGHIHTMPNRATSGRPAWQPAAPATVTADDASASAHTGSAQPAAVASAAPADVLPLTLHTDAGPAAPVPPQVGGGVASAFHAVAPTAHAPLQPPVGVAETVAGATSGGGGAGGLLR